jgi:hypothetical protein
MLKRIAKPEDYVVFKLDIDNSKIEAMFVEQLLASPELLALVDDFFFEHHVNVVSCHTLFKPMVGKSVFA